MTKKYQWGLGETTQLEQNAKAWMLGLLALAGLWYAFKFVE